MYKKIFGVHLKFQRFYDILFYICTIILKSNQRLPFKNQKLILTWSVVHSSKLFEQPIYVNSNKRFHKKKNLRIFVETYAYILLVMFEI